MSKCPKGATGSGPSKSKKANPLTNGHTKLLTVDALTNGHQHHNGHTVETLGESRASSTSSGYDSSSCCVEEQTRHHPHVNGAGANGLSQVQLIYRDPKTIPIIKRIFHKLLTDSNMERDVIKCFEISEQTLRRIPGAQIVRKAANLTCEYIQTSEHTLDSLVEDFRSDINWDIQPANMHPEYRRVADDMFSDSITWGRVISFLRFAVAYSIYIHSRGMTRAVESIQAWTVEVIEEDLGTFFRENNGWEGYADFVEVSVRAQKKIIQTHKANPHNHTGTEEPGFWRGMYAVGAVAVGAAAAFTLTKAFS